MENEKNKQLENPSQPVLLTEEEYNKIARAKTREKINIVTRVIGILAILAIVILGMIPVFCLSVFGWLFIRDIYITAWQGIGNSGAIKMLCYMMGSPDGTYYPGCEWLGTVFLSLIIIGVTLGMIYLLTYNIADLIQFFKSFYISTRDLIRDIKGVAKDSVDTGVDRNVSKEQKKLEKEEAKRQKIEEKRKAEEEKQAEKLAAKKEKEEAPKNLFAGAPLEDITIETKEDPKPEEKKRKVEQPVGGYTTEELDALLRGEQINH